MKLYDATLSIHEKMMVFPGDPPFEHEAVSRISSGDDFNLTRLHMATHLGTHVDPPAHYIKNGVTVDRIPLETLVGPGVVADLRSCAQIDAPALEKAGIKDEKRILLKTDNGPRLSASSFHAQYVDLSEDGAQFLIERGVCLVGIDSLSIEHHENPGAPVHHMLLEAGILVVEGVHLLDIPPGKYEIFCLPLKIKDGDGAPARVILRG
ncbi:MAG: cyclase family protein [Deltaproteobacteria bacterium]|nr:cyclase family protein [Deltaproteobacteria bacterium]